MRQVLVPASLSYTSSLSLSLDLESEGSVALKNAWGELAAIEKETRRYKKIREKTEHELELCRQKGVKLEDVRAVTWKIKKPNHIKNLLISIAGAARTHHQRRGTRAACPALPRA